MVWLLLVCWVVMCNAIFITDHDWRMPGLSNLPLDAEYGNNRTREIVI